MGYEKQHVHYIFCKTPDPVFVAWTTSEQLASAYISGRYRLVDELDSEYDDYICISVEMYTLFQDDIYDKLREIGENECVDWIPRSEENIMRYELATISSNDRFYITTVDFLDTIENAIWGGDAEEYMKRYMGKVARLYTVLAQCVTGQRFSDAKMMMEPYLKMFGLFIRYFHMPMEMKDDALASLISDHIDSVELYQEMHYMKE